MRYSALIDTAREGPLINHPSLAYALLVSTVVDLFVFRHCQLYGIERMNVYTHAAPALDATHTPMVYL